MFQRVGDWAVAAVGAGINHAVWNAIGHVGNRALVLAVGAAMGIPPGSEAVVLAAIQATTGAALTTGIREGIQTLIGRVNPEIASQEINNETVKLVEEVVLHLSENDLGFMEVRSGGAPPYVSESGDAPAPTPEVPFYRQTWMKVLSYVPIIGLVSSIVAKYQIKREVAEERNADHKIELIKESNQYSVAQIVSGVVFIAFVIMGCVLDLFTYAGLIPFFTGMSIGSVGISLIGLINNQFAMMGIRNGTVSRDR